MTYAEILTTVSTIVAVLGYLHERNKREKVELRYTEVNTKLQIAQQSNQSVNATMQQSTIVVNKTVFSDEDIKQLRQAITFATATTASSLALGLADSPNESKIKALEDKFPTLDKTIKEQEKK